MRQDDDLSYFETPEFREVLAKYETARENRAAIYMDADELTDVAEYYAMVCHDDDRAAEAVDLALQLHPDAVDPQIFRARKRMLDGDVKTAQLMCDAIEDQQHREVIFLRAELLIRQQRNAEALDYLLEEAEAVDEDLDYFFFDSAYIFMDYDDYALAQKLSEQLESMAPKWFKTCQLRADVLLAQDNFAAAIPYIERILDVDPFFVEAWNWSCEAYCGLMQYDKALESCDYALAVEPQNERALQLKAWVLLQQGNCEAAHELYQQLQRINPTFELNYLYDSFCLYDRGDLTEALRLVEKAEELSRGESTEQQAIWEHHAHLLSELHDTEHALQLLDKAEQQYGQSGEQVDYNILRARVYADNQQPEQTIKCIENCARKYIHDLPFVLFQGGQVFYEGGYFLLAREYFQQVLDTPLDTIAYESPTPKNADDVSVEQLYGNTWAYLSACSYELHDLETSLEEMKRAVELGATNLPELFGSILPLDTPLSDYVDYYYYHLFGTWPEGTQETDELPF